MSGAKPPATLLSSFKGINMATSGEEPDTEAAPMVSAARQQLQAKKAAKIREEDEDLVFSFGKGLSAKAFSRDAKREKPAPVSLLDQVADSFNEKDAGGEWSSRGVALNNPKGRKKALSKKQKQRLMDQQDRGEAYSNKLKGGKMVKQKRKQRMNKLKKIY